MNTQELEQIVSRIRSGDTVVEATEALGMGNQSDIVLMAIKDRDNYEELSGILRSNRAALRGSQLRRIITLCAKLRQTLIQCDEIPKELIMPLKDLKEEIFNTLLNTPLLVEQKCSFITTDEEQEL